MDDHTLKLILPAGDIPLGATVTKKNGEKLYTLLDRIRVFPAGEKGVEAPMPEVCEIVAVDGTRFITAPRCDANVVAATTELVWHVSVEALSSWLEETYEM